MATPDAIPAERLTPGDFVTDCEADDLVYFLLNVGDGDSQLILLPADRTGTRQAVVIDVATVGKLPALVGTLTEHGLLGDRADLFPVVVGTHPHEDHIAGMAEFLDRFGGQVREYWEPGYYHPSAGYLETMRSLEEHSSIQHSQPTSGFTRFIGQVRVVVLAPAISLRNRFDSYGININNASIALKLEFPAARVEQRDAERRYLRLRRTQALVLGADAQTLSWGHVMTDFPELRPSESPVAKWLRMALGADPLRAQIFKVPHHASKHGVTLELVELIKPALTFVSCAAGGGRYNFPHTVAQEAVREALQAIASTQKHHSPDYDLGIHYTCAADSAEAPLGSLALVVSPTGRKRRLWRFGDRAGEPIDFGRARLYRPAAEEAQHFEEPDTVPV